MVCPVKDADDDRSRWWQRKGNNHPPSRSSKPHTSVDIQMLSDTDSYFNVSLSKGQGGKSSSSTYTEELIVPFRLISLEAVRKQCESPGQLHSDVHRQLEFHRNCLCSQDPLFTRKEGWIRLNELQLQSVHKIPQNFAQYPLTSEKYLKVRSIMANSRLALPAFIIKTFLPPSQCTTPTTKNVLFM